jgi:uncharacterized protein YjbI with pentapeptide repeats
MKIEIKNRFTGSVIFSHEQEYNSIKITLKAAISCDANLCDADLRGADLCGANLCDADLRGANLCDADLRGADLRGANLCDANLCDANLRGANLCDANLRGANLFGDKLTKTPLFLFNLTWDVTITTTFLRIGCKVHLISDWKKFDDEKITEMSSSALKFWKRYKTAIIALCDAHCEEE